MFEVTLMLLVFLLITACAFLPWNMLFPPKSTQHPDVASDSCSNLELRAPKDSTSNQSFLTHLQSEIESALFPRPTDSVLQRHYDALISAKLENLLAAMPDS
jgi:hypothetical protein